MSLNENTSKIEQLLNTIADLPEAGGGSGGNVDLTGYATEQYVQDYAQPKGNYLTEHQDISGKLDASALPTAINAALAQAKASGEFKGEDGKDGKDGQDGQDGKDGVNGQDGYTPVKGVDYFDGKDGQDGKNGIDGKDGADGFSPVANVTQTDTGAVISITDKSGTTTATIANGKDGEKGDKGDTGAQGEQGIQGVQGEKGEKGDTGATGATGSKGADGVGISSVKQTTTSSADGGSNVVTVTLSNGTTSTFTVNNGSKGSAGTNGTNGKDGKTPVKGVDFWTAADQEAIVQDVITALGTPVFGRVDADNNIILTGELTDGTYTLKYEDAEGNVTEVGNVTVGETMPDSGEVELVWTQTKLDKTTGAEGSGDGYYASQHIDIVDGYAYTASQTYQSGTQTIYGGITICYYGTNGNYLGYKELWAAASGENTKAIELMDGATTFRVRLYAGSGSMVEECYHVTFEKTA